MSPHISIVTNIAPNHLDRHKTMENYIGAKKAIIHYQQKDDYAIMNYDDLTLKKWEGESKGRHLWFSATKELVSMAPSLKITKLLLIIIPKEPLSPVQHKLT